MSKMFERQRVLETIANVDNYGDGVAYEVLGHVYRDVALIPTVDAVPVIRCKDCQHWDEEDRVCGLRDCYGWDYKPDSFCSWAERKMR